MTTCELHASGVIELYFYGELDAAEHARAEHHLTRCAECRRALDDLQTIRAALAARPDVSAPSGGDWTSFMTRLDDAVRNERTSATARTPHNVLVFSRARSSVGYLAMAALLALVTISVVIAWRNRSANDAEIAGRTSPEVVPMVTSTGARAQGGDAAFLTLSEHHFERSKLVVLGLATKDPADTSGADWEYERELAGTLLTDTRLYRLAAEERGLGSLARVMQDLELVLLQASMSDKPDASALEALQRVIRKRDLLTKIELVTTTAGI